MPLQCEPDDFGQRRETDKDRSRHTKNVHRKELLVRYCINTCGTSCLDRIPFIRGNDSAVANCALSERLHHSAQKWIDEQQPTQCEQKEPQLLFAVFALLTLGSAGVFRLRLTKQIGIKSHVHRRENGQQRHGPGDLGGAVAHTAGIDAKVKTGEYNDAGQLNGEREEDGTIIERATTPSENGNTPVD